MRASSHWASTYDELRRIANRFFAGEQVGHTLQPTAIVNEAWLRLADSRDLKGADRVRFLTAAASAMRRVLVDHARGKKRQKRGGGLRRVALDTSALISQKPALDLVKLDDTLSMLARESPRRARIVELRYFGGLTVEETAVALGVAPRTVGLEWRSAKAWLRRALRATDEDRETSGDA